MIEISRGDHYLHECAIEVLSVLVVGFAHLFVLYIQWSSSKISRIYFAFFWENQHSTFKNKFIFMILTSKSSPRKVFSPKIDKNFNFTSMENVNNPNPWLVFSSWSIGVKFKFLWNYGLKTLRGELWYVRNMDMNLFSL